MAKPYVMNNPRNDPAHGWTWRAYLDPADVDLVQNFDGIKDVINWSNYERHGNPHVASCEIFADPRYDVEDTWLRLCAALDQAAKDRTLDSLLDSALSEIGEADGR